MDPAENFALSLVSLALVKNGYRTYKGVPPGLGPEADILVVGNDERFAVEVRVPKRRNAISKRLNEQRAKCEAAFGVPTYFAFLVDDESLLLVDPELHRRMRFRDDEVRLEEIAAGEPLPAG